MSMYEHKIQKTTNTQKHKHIFNKTQQTQTQQQTHITTKKQKHIYIYIYIYIYINLYDVILLIRKFLFSLFRYTYNLLILHRCWLFN